MSKIPYVLSVLLLFLASSAKWEAIGPYGGILQTLALAPSDNDIIYVSNNEDPSEGPSIIFKSTDSGNSWFRVGKIVDWIYSFTIDPANPDIIYAGSYKKIYKSTNSGMSWDCYPVSDYYLNDVEIHPTAPQTLHAVGANCIGNYTYMAYFKSTDGGINWVDITLASEKGYSNCITQDPQDADIIYVGGYVFTDSSIPQLFKSSDGGSNFTEITSGYFSDCNYIYSLSTHPTNSNMIYAGTDIGIYRSTDGGNSWSRMATYELIYSLATSHADPDVVYAGANDEVYKSTDCGSSWSNTGSGIVGRRIYGLAVDEVDINQVFAVNNRGFYKTTDGGTGWAKSNKGINLATITDITVAPASPLIIYTQFYNQFVSFGLYKSVDAGSTWMEISNPLACGKICEFVFGNNNPDLVFAFEGAG